MNVNSFKKPVFTFLLGAFFGVAIIVSYSFINHNATPGNNDQVIAIDSNTAQQLRNKYFESAPKINEVLRGFTVNKEQLDAMNRLNSENAEFIGFRIYMGTSQHEGRVSVVYGIDQNGRDSNENSIYSTGFDFSGPCPPVCD